MLLLIVAGAAGGATQPTSSPASHPAALRTVQAAHYTIHTDLDAEAAREAQARLDALWEEYRQRTASFCTVGSGRLVCYLYSRQEDYLAAGGPPGTAGCFTGKALAAVAPAGQWRTIQHEAFHQFAAAGAPRLGVWLQEGLAEYFGHAEWTGDGFVVGLVPPWRLARLKEEIDGGRLLPFEQIMALGRDQWNRSADLAAYDQAWSMAHFLAHADDGKYRAAGEALVDDLAAGTPLKMAFARHFGDDVAAFQKRYTQWWRQQAADPTRHLRDQATAQTLNAFLVRAARAGHSFDTAEGFLAACRNNELRLGREQWLPPSLLATAVVRAKALTDQGFRWELRRPSTAPATQPTQPASPQLVLHPPRR
jgi:hypothetical protein